MDATIIIAVVPVVLLTAYIIWLVRAKITEGREIDLREPITALVICLVAVLIIGSMTASTVTYTYSEETSTLYINQNLIDRNQPFDSYGDEIKSVVIGNNCRIVESGTLDSLTNLNFVTIGEGVEVRSGAFSIDFMDPFGAPLDDLQGRFAVYEGTAYLSDPSIYSYNGTLINGFATGVSGVVAAALPSEANGTKITGIEARAFRDDASVVFVTDFPDSSITTTGINSFTAAAALEKARLSKATSIGNYTFQSCTSLASIEAPEAVTLGNYAFDGSAVSEVDFPRVTTVGQRCFRNCTSLVAAILPSALTLDNDVFNGCTSLSDIDLRSVRSIGSGEFTGAVFEVADLPELESIGNYAFQNCSSMTSLKIPKAKTVGTRSFNGCTGIEEVAFGPLETVAADSFNSWTFYESDGTTQIDKTVASNLAGKTFQGTAAALVEVAEGQLTLTPDQIQQVHLHDQELQTMLDQPSIDPLPFQPTVQTQDQEPVSA